MSTTVQSRDVDRIENCLTKATGIISVLTACYDAGQPMRPQALENTLWCVQDQLDEIRDILFPKSAKPADDQTHPATSQEL